jgi:hypothetical protein
MLVMNFIVDVSNQGGANASLTREFRTIIQYMHEVSQSSGKNKDPNVQKIFKMLNNNFSMMEKKTGVTPSAEESKLDTTKPLDEQPSDLEIASEKQSKRIEKQKAKKQAKKKKKLAKGEDVVSDSTELDEITAVDLVVDSIELNEITAVDVVVESVPTLDTSAIEPTIKTEDE